MLKKIQKNKFLKIFTNKYVFLISVFFIWMFFFDENSYLNHRELNKEIKKLEKEKKMFSEEITKDTILENNLKNKEKLEKFAREEYLMKKENEDIYIIEYDTIEK